LDWIRPGTTTPNVLVHAINGLLLFLVLKRATGMVWRSWMVAALFTLHPLNVESVDWIAERKNLLSLLFFLLTLGAYRWYAIQPRMGAYFLVAWLFACGLMSKPQVITLPFVLLLWDYWPLRRTPSANPGDRSPCQTNFRGRRSSLVKAGHCFGLVLKAGDCVQ
jgi:hypothetical protein